MNYRIEQDTLGEIHVPEKAYFGAQTQRAVENFPISGLKPHTSLVWATVLIKKAAALVNAELGVLDPSLARAIVQAADEVLRGELADQFVVDPFQAGAGTSHHMNVNEVLANRANELLGHPLGSYRPVHPNDHVNFGQSTNDVFPTAMRLALLKETPRLLDELEALEKTFREKVRANQEIVTSGRTHLQDAVPIRVGDELGAYASAIQAARVRIKHSADGLRQLGIGGSAAGTGLNTHPNFRRRVVEVLGELSGFRLLPAEDLFYAMNSMDVFVAYSGALRGLCVELTRIANDLRLLSSGPNTGLAEIRLPPVQPGSSIMPGKVNPVMAEMLNMVCFHVIGADTAVNLAAQAGQLQLNVMMPVIAFELLFSVDILSNALRVFRQKCVAGLQVNAERCRWYFERTLGLATILNQVVGYQKAAEVVKEAQRTGKPIPQVAVERGILTSDEARRVFSPEAVTRPGLLRLPTPRTGSDQPERPDRSE